MKSWLDRLQQESWQLELIISGFALFGLFQAFKPIELALNSAEQQEQTQFVAALIIATISCSILSFTLLFHVILRGLWIGALGLRYVSGDIDYKKLNYSPKFDNYLRRRIGSFDKYIARLENYCSILFAVSFLLIFYVLSFILTLLFIGLFIHLVIDTTNVVAKIIYIVFLFVILLGMLLTFIDFLTQGYLKKKKWLTFIYFPFYWIFSFLTLSFLYRPLVYNFLDNKLGKRISFILIPSYFIIVVITSLNYTRSNYLLERTDNTSTYYSNTTNYEEFLDKENEFIENAAIPSKVIETSYLKVFLKYNERIENTIFDFNKSLKPKEDKRGLKSDIFEGIKYGKNKPYYKDDKDNLKVDYFKTLKEIHTIKIDSIVYNDIDFVYTNNKNNQLGFETFLNIKNLPTGRHNLIISRLSKIKDSITVSPVASIPFWYYPN